MFDITKQKFTIKKNADNIKDIVIERVGETDSTFTVKDALKGKATAENNLKQIKDVVEKTEKDLVEAREKLPMVNEIEKLEMEDITAIGSFINKLHLIQASKEQIKDTEMAIEETTKFLQKLEEDTGLKVLEVESPYVEETNG